MNNLPLVKHRGLTISTQLQEETLFTLTHVLKITNLSIWGSSYFIN